MDRLAYGALYVLLLLAGTSGAVGAADFSIDLEQLGEISPRPGTVIDAANLERHAHLVDRDFARFVSGGFATLEVDDPLSFRPHPAFEHATRRYGGQARLGESPGLLEDFVHGLPFPTAADTPNDASAGTRLAWNMRYAYTGDSGRIPEMFWQLRDWRGEDVDFEMHFEARTMRFMYRHVLAPIPAIEDNPQDAYGAFFLNAVDAGSYDGTQALVFANRDEAREVNGWVYIPQLERTQTLAAFSTEESMFGSDILPTDFLVYSGRLTDMRWQHLGNAYMLLPFYRHDRVELSSRKARKHDYWHVDFTGRGGCFPKVHWQLRRIAILEGTATDPAAPVQRRLLYVDRQTHVVPFWKVYKEGNRLWKFVITSYAHPNSHLAHNNESGAPIATAASTIDIETNRCTTLQMLTLVNVDDLSGSDFDTAGIQSGSRGYRRR